MSTKCSSIATQGGFERSKRTTLPLSGMLGAALLFMALIATTFDFVHAEEGASFSVNFQTLFRLGVCAALGLYGIAHLPLTKREFFRFPGAWAILILLWAAVTSLFSISVMYSLASVFTLACVTLFVPAALSQLGGLKTVNTCLVGLLCFVALNWSLHYTMPSLARSAFVMPDGEIVYRFGNDSQQLGLQIVWALGFLLMSVLGRFCTWRFALVPIIVLVGTLPLTQARAPAAAGLAVTATVIWPYSPIRQRFLAIAALLIVFAGACFVAESGVDFPRRFSGLAQKLSRSGQVEELTRFTGRTEIWQFAWNRCFDSPLFGFGYGAARFALQEDPNYPLNFQADHAHNLYLNVALTMGFPGLLLVVCMIVHMLLRNMRYGSTVVSIALTMIVITSVTEAILYGPMTRSHTVIWLIALFWQQMGMQRDVENLKSMRRDWT